MITNFLQAAGRRLARITGDIRRKLSDLGLDVKGKFSVSPKRLRNPFSTASSLAGPARGIETAILSESISEC